MFSRLFWLYRWGSGPIAAPVRRSCTLWCPAARRWGQVEWILEAALFIWTAREIGSPRNLLVCFRNERGFLRASGEASPVSPLIKPLLRALLFKIAARD